MHVLPPASARAILAALCMLLGGCQVARLDHGRTFAVAAAAHAGLYHAEKGRWPSDVAELRDLGCPQLDARLSDDPQLDARLFNDPAGNCRFIATSDYRLSLRPTPAGLGVTVRDGPRLVCHLRVIAPSADTATSLTPMMVLHTHLFSCPGGGKPAS